MVDTHKSSTEEGNTPLKLCRVLNLNLLHIISKLVSDFCQNSPQYTRKLEAKSTPVKQSTRKPDAYTRSKVPEPEGEIKLKPICFEVVI